MDSDRFRRQATAVFRVSVVALVLTPVVTAGLGWWAGRWWGLIGGIALGGAVLFVGLTMGAFLYAMSQDGG